MKKRIVYILLGVLLGFTSCDEFLTLDPTDSISDKDAFSSVGDFESNLTGVYSTLGGSGMLGRDLYSVAELCSDVATHNSASFNLQKLAAWSVTDTDDDVLAMWRDGYQVIDRAARIIENGKDSTNTEIYGYVAQAYALRAWSTFYLTNLYGLPYTYDPTSLGVVNVESPIAAGEEVSRSTVAQNYEFILSDIAAAEACYGQPGVVDPGVYYFNEAAVYALDARVNLFMGNYTEAREAALHAISLFGGSESSLASTTEDYSVQWNTSAMSSEDIMRFQRSATQTTSYYFMWGPSGGAEFVGSVIDEIPSTDVRLEILTSSQWGKFVGTELGSSTLSIPMFRLPELYLTIAETYAQQDEYGEAASYLSIVSEARHSALEGNIVADAGILAQIQEERKWETLQEGFRFFDVRRWGLDIDANGGLYPNFDIKEFCFPVPANEVNAGYGVIQTEGWEDALPSLD